MKNFSIRTKLLLIVSFAIICVSLIILSISIYDLKKVGKENVEAFVKNAYIYKENSLRGYVQIATQGIKKLLKKQENGEITKEEAQKQAIEFIANLKYGKDGYFSINDSNNIMVYHPSSSLLKKDLTNLKDTTGKYFLKEMSQKAKTQGNGLIEYKWNKPNETQASSKYTYFEYIKPWDWIVATGSYLDDVEASIALMEKKNSEILSEAIISIVVSSIIAIILFTILIIFLSNKTIINPLIKLSNTVKALTKYSSADQKINIDSNDEIGQVAKHLNDYLENNRKIMAQDQKIVEESEKAIEMVRAGFLSYRIKHSTDNRSTNDLKIAINELIDDLSGKFNILNNALIKYSSGNFNHEFEIKDVSGIIGSLSISAKSIGDNVSEIIAMIMQSGESLSENINTLTTSADSLSKSANEQAASLEETAAAIEEITSNIKNNTNKIIEMKEIDDKVLNLAQNGKNLANQTVNSMNDIDDEVTAISEAISVIDQIAFQTNILSLNAAVEAATAGEAGKGFAVVAQEVRNLASRSAEAAKEIKDLVDKATNKAHQGKTVADEMINGYEQLQSSISDAKNLIDDITVASKEQEVGIAQINDSINILDKNTQENAEDANNIFNLSNMVNHLSQDLLTVAHNAEYNQKAKEQIADLDLTQELNKLKLQHISFKENAFAKLDDRVKFTVTDERSCNLGKWILEKENEGVHYTKTPNWTKLKEEHTKVHKNVQYFLDRNLEHSSNKELIDIGNSIEDSTLGVFKALDTIKIEVSQKKDSN